jgi:hypothetical protein
MHKMNVPESVATKTEIEQWFANQPYSDYTLNLIDDAHSFMFNGNHKICNVTIHDDNVSVAFRLAFSAEMGHGIDYYVELKKLMEETANRMTEMVSDQFLGQTLDKDNLDIIKAIYYSNAKIK